MPKRLKCCECGCEDLEYAAVAHWDFEKQRFLFTFFDDYVSCPQCGDQTLVDEVEVEEIEHLDISD
jgi:hypothetical protein